MVGFQESREDTCILIFFQLLAGYLAFTHRGVSFHSVFLSLNKDFLKEVTCHTLISYLELSGNEKAEQVFIGKEQARVKPRESS